MSVIEKELEKIALRQSKLRAEARRLVFLSNPLRRGRPNRLHGNPPVLGIICCAPFTIERMNS